MYVYRKVCFFFFFQAEDGIRDHCVTGVQTCALPICAPRAGASFSESTRAIRSGELPAGKGTIRWIARDGQVFASLNEVCANADAVKANASATARTNSRSLRGDAP